MFARVVKNLPSEPVAFPNYTSGAHPALLDLIYISNMDNVFPGKRYGFVLRHMPSPYRPVAKSLSDAIAGIGNVCNPKRRERPNFKALGMIPGAVTKHMVEDIQRNILHRAIGCARQLEAKISSGADPLDLMDDRNMVFFIKDVVLMSAVVQARCAFLPGYKLMDYIGLLDRLKVVLGNSSEIEALVRRLKLIVPKDETDPTPPANTLAQAA